MKGRINRRAKSAAGSLSLLGLIWLSHNGVLNAAMFDVTGFSKISGAQFYDAPSGNRLTPVTIGGVVITPDVSLLNQSFAGANAPQYGPDVPGNGAGFGSDSTGFGGATPLMLNFSEPVAAFGATFVHFENIIEDPSFTSPVMIQAFSGLNGAGTLLGTVVDSSEGVSLHGRAFADFKGLWSDSLQIRSVEICATRPSGGFQVDGYAVSVTPIPEPLTLVLVGGGLVGLGIALRYTKKK